MEAKDEWPRGVVNEPARVSLGGIGPRDVVIQIGAPTSADTAPVLVQVIGAPLMWGLVVATRSQLLSLRTEVNRAVDRMTFFREPIRSFCGALTKAGDSAETRALVERIAGAHGYRELAWDEVDDAAGLGGIGPHVVLTGVR